MRENWGQVDGDGTCQNPIIISVCLVGQASPLSLFSPAQRRLQILPSSSLAVCSLPPRTIKGEGRKAFAHYYYYLTHPPAAVERERQARRETSHLFRYILYYNLRFPFHRQWLERAGWRQPKKRVSSWKSGEENFDSFSSLAPHIFAHV